MEDTEGRDFARGRWCRRSTGTSAAKVVEVVETAVVADILTKYNIKPQNLISTSRRDSSVSVDLRETNTLQRYEAKI